MKLSTRKHIKLAAHWAAFFVLATAAVLLVSLMGAELAGVEAKFGWALAKVAIPVTAGLCLLGWLCEQIED
jgi:hypothetical protein